MPNKQLLFTSLGLDHYNQIYLGTNKGYIYKLDTFDNSLNQFEKIKYYVFSIHFNTQNDLYTIVPYAVYKPSIKKVWDKFDHTNGQLVTKKKILKLFYIKINKYFNMPDISYLDNNDKLWMAKTFGEFGTELQIFNTVDDSYGNPNFDSLNNGLLFPKSFFNDNNNNVYITSGLSHLGNFGQIIKINTKREVSIIFDSKDFVETSDSSFYSNQLFVGPGAFNEFNNTIVISTNDGFYELTLTNSDKRISEMRLLFKPELAWEREPLAIGNKMAIKKISIIDNKRIAFLTSNNGIGYWDGKKLTMLK